MSVNKMHIFLQRYAFLNALILFAFSFFIFPTTDTYYYWTWSQHLQLSYLDGPPMIAYLLWLSTHIFGNNFFAIEIISIFAIYGSCFLIYKIVQLYRSNIVALTAASLWLMYPFATTRFVAVSMTLDGLEVFFSLLIVYVAFKWRASKNNNYIYLLGVACGLGLLAKYNVIIIIAGLLLYFLSQRELRSIYFKCQTYIALLITLLMFTPVLIWNYNNHWISFYYQLNLHKWVGNAGAINSHDKYGLKGVWFYLTSCFFGVLNVYLLILAYYKFGKIKSQHNIVPTNRLDISFRSGILFLIWFITLFWLIESYTKHIGLNYMTTLSCFFAMMVAESLNDKAIKFTQILLILFSFISIIMLIDKSRLHNSDLPNYEKYIKSGLIKRGI